MSLQHITHALHSNDAVYDTAKPIHATKPYLKTEIISTKKREITSSSGRGLALSSAFPLIPAAESCEYARHFPETAHLRRS